MYVYFETVYDKVYWQVQQTSKDWGNYVLLRCYVVFLKLFFMFCSFNIFRKRWERESAQAGIAVGYPAPRAHSAICDWKTRCSVCVCSLVCVRVLPAFSRDTSYVRWYVSKQQSAEGCTNMPVAGALGAPG